jgi:hypothetical protein
MGKLKGILPIEGSVGQVNFAKTQDGIIVREKGGVSAERIATDPVFVRTRENNAEFKTAANGAKLLYDAFRTLRSHADRRAFSRLLKTTMAALKADSVNARGERTIMDGNPLLLSGFQLNDNAKIGSVLLAPYTTSVTRSSGALDVSLAAFVPDDSLVVPDGATHFELILQGIEAHFDTGTSVKATDTTGVLPLGSSATSTISLQTSVTAASTAPLIMALGVSFYQSVNGTMYPLRQGKHNALGIVKVAV